jgi:hypothetical protein
VALPGIPAYAPPDRQIDKKLQEEDVNRAVDTLYNRRQSRSA